MTAIVDSLGTRGSKTRLANEQMLSQRFLISMSSTSPKISSYTKNSMTFEGMLTYDLKTHNQKTMLPRLFRYFTSFSGYLSSLQVFSWRLCGHHMNGYIIIQSKIYIPQKYFILESGNSSKK
jgi:hypothetical protein